MLNIKATPIPGCFEVETTGFEDHRGFFYRLFCAKELEPAVGMRRVVNVNHSQTAKVGAIRGMHFQYPPNCEMKMVRCLQGSIFDVCVDLRKDSPTYLQWYGVELTPEKHNMLIVPEGCAHGFQVLKPNSDALYFSTNFYCKENEGGIRFNDPAIDIQWPCEPTDLSEKDLVHPLIDENFDSRMTLQNVLEVKYDA